MNDVLKALDRSESVSVLYHGKVKGVITPAGALTDAKVTRHPYFGMRSTATSVDKVMHDLRGGRHRDL
jgi:hypothetical protein